MENTRSLNRNLETYAWAVFFIWWGITCRVQGHRTQKSPETSYTLLLSRHIRTSD
ncbi:MAG: hypothetical protein HZB50_19170 [Chloroflexi bacterium]|nr:hypothetical protein [Chloroflexota bacterium]